MHQVHRKFLTQECADIWIRLPRHKWLITNGLKSWSSIEDSVVPLERKRYGHPLEGLVRKAIRESTVVKWMWKVPNWECLFVDRQVIFVVCVRGTIPRWLERRETLIVRWRYGRNTLFWENQHHSWAIFTWDVFKLNAKQARILLKITGTCWNLRSLLEQQKFARKTHATIVTWSYDTEGHAKKCVWKILRIGKQKTMQQLHKATTPSVDHQFKEEDLASMADLSTGCPQIVLNCPYLARIGRLDILWLVNKLARTVSKWTRAWDKRLARLISYTHCTSGYMQFCHVENTAHCRSGLFQDSDFAEDLEDSTSTSGGTLCIFGSHTFVPRLDMWQANFGLTQFDRVLSCINSCRLYAWMRFPFSIFCVLVINVLHYPKTRALRYWLPNKQTKTHIKQDGLELIHVDDVSVSAQSCRSGTMIYIHKIRTH